MTANQYTLYILFTITPSIAWDKLESKTLQNTHILTTEIPSTEDIHTLNETTAYNNTIKYRTHIFLSILRRL